MGADEAVDPMPYLFSIYTRGKVIRLIRAKRINN